jgi:uncharacterized protein
VAREIEERQADVLTLARRVLDAVASHDLDALWSACADDVVFEWPFLGATVTDIETFRLSIVPVVTLLEDWTFTDIEADPMHDQNSVVLRYKGTATIATTGKPYRQTYLTQMRFRNGELTLYREYYDTAVLRDALQPDG